MSVFLTCVLAAASLGVDKPAANGAEKTAKAERPRRRIRVVSPQVHPDRRVTVRYRPKSAKRVELAGELGDYPMTRDEDGLWSVTTDPVKPDVYVYWFLVDGVRTGDPKNRAILAAAESVVLVPSEKAPWFEDRLVPRGVVHQHRYLSKALGGTRRVHVYTPPGYDPRKAERYPVAFLLHGLGNDDSHWIGIGRANAILDNLIADGKAEPMVLVMPDGFVPDVEENRWFGDPAIRAALAHDLCVDVLSLVESNYRVSPRREDRALAGVSMGGYQALFIGLDRLDRFAEILSLSAFLPDDFEAKLTERGVGKETNRRLDLLWIGCGKRDRFLARNEKLHRWLDERGVNHTWVVSDHTHNWHCWREDLRDVLPLLFRHRSTQGESVR